MVSAQVVIQTAFLGDLILTIPFLRRIKKNNSELKTILICKEGLSDFLLSTGEVDLAFEIKKGDRKSYSQILEELKAYQIENLYCVHRSLRSQLFSAQVKCPNKIGFSSWLSWLIFDQSYSYPKSWPDAIRKFKLLVNQDPETQKQIQAITDLSALNTSLPDGKLPPVPEFFSINKNENQKPLSEKKICLFPGSVWATKKWTAEGYKAVAKHFVQSGYQVLLMGSKDESNLCEQIAEGLPKVEILAGKLSILESIQTIQSSQLVVANDSAATHMAALTQTPSITIFGPTTLNLGFRPWSNNARVVENKSLTCRPCGAHGPMVCPLEHHNCMKQIQPNEVIQSAISLLP